MKKRLDRFIRVFYAGNIHIIECHTTFDDINIELKSKRLSISIELSSAIPDDLYSVSIDGLSIEQWVERLLHQRVLSITEVPNISNILYINGFSVAYQLELLHQILQSRIPESVHIESIDINEH